MTMKKTHFALVACAGISMSPALASEALLLKHVFSEANALFLPLPSVDDVLAESGFSDEMVDLGRHLFFDTRVSVSDSMSCASCHDLDIGGVDGNATSIGHDGSVGGRNAPTVLNAALNVDQFWDGRAPNLAEQAKGPVENPIEMGNSRENLIHTLSEIPGYLQRFSHAFPNDENPVNFDNFATAIAAFETTLLTPSRFDDFLRGNMSALTLGEVVGLEVFMDLGCAECHNGVNLGGNSYQYFGAINDPSVVHMPREDTGVALVSGDKADEYMFRVPPLRNIALTEPYFHTGSAETLAEAVQVMAEVQLGTTLDKYDTQLIISFLSALSGQQPQVTIPDPLQIPEPDPIIGSEGQEHTDEMLMSASRAPAR